ncbi:uncharacterized protein B0H18DRAFT_998204, partial [Fomitopsis serialis]|uniref:uncharacterized protein n=1 Tax=Fomitopsis serialis TaxID=139415 RepID=UPI002008E820
LAEPKRTIRCARALTAEEAAGCRLVEAGAITHDREHFGLITWGVRLQRRYCCGRWVCGYHRARSQSLIVL